jgi:hypothetical protein
MGDEASPELKERELQLAETRAANERELKQQELALSELKLRQDRELKEQELRIQGRQIAIGRWSGPVAVAVVAGLLGIVGTFFSARENRELERKKQEGTLVLEAIRTGASGKEREQQAAANLVFLADAGLVNLTKEQTDKLREKAGDSTPSLPAGTVSSQPTIPEPARQQILKSLDEFATYFQGNGAKTTPKVRVDSVPPGTPAIAYYDPDKSTVYIDTAFLSEVDLPLREYAHAVLYADRKLSAIDYERTWAYVGVESGLASYFASSFRNNPRVPVGDSAETLDNTRSLATLKPGPMIQMDGLYGWGGAFWELRKLLGPKTTDRILLAAWQAMGEVDIRRNDARDFVGSILKAESQLEKSQHQIEIKELFARRGLAQG